MDRTDHGNTCDRYLPLRHIPAGFIDEPPFALVYRSSFGQIADNGKVTTTLISLF